ncbi:MAG: hypothetical protein JWM10_3171, partial [Myxococcaceae bacterium]|nr:hypothetical protein [Myxococcaceae bacterium]
AAAAFEARTAQAAGTLLAQAVAGYLTGHSFMVPGVTTMGTSAPPLALPGAIVALVAVFSDVDASLDTRAQRVAAACTSLATTTLVVFAPSPIPPPICPPPSMVS